MCVRAGVCVSMSVCVRGDEIVCVRGGEGCAFERGDECVCVRGGCVRA